MRIDVVVPAYNEEAIIGESIRELKQTLTAVPFEYHVIVADNGSNDRTAVLAREAGVEVLHVPTRGKGAALAYAAQASSVPLFAFIDADLSAHPRELLRLLDVLMTRNADIVIGSRLLGQSGVHRSFLRTFSSRSFNLLQRMLLGISVTDTQCGLKLMNEKGTKILAACKEEGWFLDMEFLARAERAELKIVEIPVEWEEFRFAGRTSKLRVVQDGVGAILAMIRIRKRLS